jgi:hypothetical protein
MAVALPVLLLAAAAAVSGLLGLRQGPVLAGYAAGLAVWSVARLAVLLALATSADLDRRKAVVAWAVSLPPFALSAVPGLGVVAFALSAIIAHRALASVGASPTDATRLVAWAYGGHAVAAGAAALASAIVAA